MTKNPALLPEALISVYPNLKNFITETDSGFTIEKQDSSGFDIAIEDDGKLIYLETDAGYEDHWHIDRFEVEDECYRIVFDTIVDLISSDSRIVILCSNGKPYKWLRESKVDGEWFVVSHSGLLFWNFFGHRSEKILINKHVAL